MSPAQAKTLRAMADLVEGLRELATEFELRPAVVASGGQEGFVGVAEFARETGDSQRSILKWIGQGLIKAERHGKRWRMERAEISRFRARCSARGTGRGVRASGGPRAVAS